MTPGKLRTLREIEWPGFEVGWSPEGTLDAQAGRHVRPVVTGKPGHPGQLPYIDSWLEAAVILL